MPNENNVQNAVGFRKRRDHSSRMTQNGGLKKSHLRKYVSFSVCTAEMESRMYFSK